MKLKTKNKNLFFNTLILIISTFNSNIIFAQIFDNSQAHYKVKWHQIDTDNFRLIFPSTFKTSAPSLSQQIENYIKYSQKSLTDNPRKISIIVQQNHILQNGFVQLAPRKSEIFSTPSGIADNQEWLPNLALHELQHVTQFDKLTGNIKRPFGELLALGFFGINLPSWYYEGDATLHETLFSNGGRGRLSSWNMELRTNILSKKHYSFSKYIHGSFKDIVPSYYTIGYFMNSEMYEKDNKINANIYEEMNGKLLRPFNFQRALKKYYGTKPNQLFENTIAKLDQKWTSNTSTSLPDPIEFKDKYPTDYLLPQVENGSIYSIQKNNQRTQRIVKFDKNNPENYTEIVKTGAQLMPYFHIKKHLIVWDEYRKDARFSKQTYNVITVYNTQNNIKTTITKDSRYYTPLLSNDLKHIVCIEVDLDNKSSIAILDTYTGHKIDSIPLANGTHIQQPHLNEKSTKIIAIAISQRGTNLIEISRDTKQTKTILEWSNLQFERPVYAGNDIIFKVNQNGKDDIFLLKSGIIQQLTDSKFGAFNPSINNDTLWFNDFTLKGHKINLISLNNINSKKISLSAAETLFETQNNFKFDSISHSTVDYSALIKPYSVIKNSVNFHSLTLSANDFESFDNYKPGIYWVSNDLLNITNIKLGYEREVELRKNSYLAELSYQRYHPKFNISYKNSGNYGIAKTRTGKDSLRFDFRYHQITADIQLPFSIYRGNNVYSYGANFGTYYIKRYDLSIQSLRNFVDQIKFPLNYQVYFNKNSMMARMDLAPRWGQNFNFIYRHMPFENNQSQSWAFRSNFYFPGFVLNHSFQTRFNIQHSKGVFEGSYDIPLIDGFSFLPNYLVKNTLLFDYKLPLLYPDLSIGQLAYIKRIHGQLSADYLNIHNTDLAPKSLSAGLNFDFNLFKYNEPLFTFSVLGTYLNDSRINKKFSPTFSLSYSY
ncbi:hypothetical protein [Sphingobacterium bovistauri]|uniref:Uncharacterized protein n=1 Tax=Sphingobacterium bovistauri TaxID=2781959 RepID=A0ABS7Z9Q8_9SPHI|nr:hypothetical protein [Sphingobacterium bovistauri]MCA5005444.1 hypothetical protein [Sphingobacterium bovistauri]